jgi:hypothetical protein
MLRASTTQFSRKLGEAENVAFAIFSTCLGTGEFAARVCTFILKPTTGFDLFLTDTSRHSEAASQPGTSRWWWSSWWSPSEGERNKQNSPTATSTRK